jgi:hypothetical protein
VARKARERENYMSAQFIEDSDEEYGRDIEGFFERKAALRSVPRSRPSTALVISARCDRPSPTGTKKRSRRLVLPPTPLRPPKAGRFHLGVTWPGRSNNHTHSGSRGPGALLLPPFRRRHPGPPQLLARPRWLSVRWQCLGILYSARFAWCTFWVSSA